MNQKKLFGIFFLFVNLLPLHLNGADPIELDKKIVELIEESKIPGLSIVIVKNGKVTIRNFGYSDLDAGSKIDDQSLFEIGSCSKAFTALALLKLAQEGSVKLDQAVTDFVPWFTPTYDGRMVTITLRQLLRHTSGMPTHTISLIPESDRVDALEQTVRTVKDIELSASPGKRFEYATLNYDVIGLVIQKVTGRPFEEYLSQVVFKELGLASTFVGKENPAVSERLVKGYKIGFYSPREYDAPVYKGNNPAGYIISSPTDLAKWLQYQMGLEESTYTSLITQSHQRDETVLPENLASYAYGWYASLRGDGEIYHSGINPTFTSRIVFRKANGLGVAVLANSNSPYTEAIATCLLQSMAGEEITGYHNIPKPADNGFSMLSIVVGIFTLCVVLYAGFIVYRIITKQRLFKAPSWKQLTSVFVILLSFTPFLVGLYLLPKALANFTWDSILVWAPISFLTFAQMCLVAMGGTLLVYAFSLFFPDKNEYIRVAPQMILLSVLSGLSNTIVILLITSSINSAIEVKYLVYYFGLAVVTYLVCRKVVQTDMIHLTRDIIYNLRVKITSKIFSTSYENFEKIDRGRIYAIMDYDIVTLGQVAPTIIGIITSIITAIGVFFYMATLSFWATVVIILLIILITTLYNIVTSRTNVLFEGARESHTVYMRLLNGLIDGFRQLSIHRNKKIAYKDEIAQASNEYRVKINTASVKFVNAFLVGESLLLVVLGAVAFAVPRVFSDIGPQIIMSFVILLLYLIGPINSILNSIPQLVQFKVSWNKVQEFIKDIPASSELSEVAVPVKRVSSVVDSISINSLCYRYPGADGQYTFSVGPIDLTAQKGEVIFIIGGNGSGKTTFSKILTGLYTPQEGDILINNKKIAPSDVGEYFSTVFHPLHLFKRLYDVQLDETSSNWKELLNILELQDKVDIQDNAFTTINLSGGQRKRLALLQCFLEDRPIYLFDEWAADQDPEYRRTFYTELLPKMKKQGKIVFAITHDDHYFDVADKVIKLEMGRVEFAKENNVIPARQPDPIAIQ